MKTRLVLACAVPLITALGCSAPARPDAPAIRGVRQADTQFGNDKKAYDYFRAKGLTNFQAAGVVGNLDQESGIDPTISQFGGGPGRGIAQWSAGERWDGADGDNVVQYAQQHGQSEYSLDLQLDFIWYELTNFGDYGYEDLKNSTTLEQATQAFEDKYEGCVYANFPVCALPMRIQYAQDVLDNFGDDAPPESDDAGAPSADGGAGDGDGGQDAGSASGDGDANDGTSGDGSSGDGDSTSDGSTHGDGSSGDGDGASDGSDHAGDGDDDTSTGSNGNMNAPGMTGSSCVVSHARTADRSAVFFASALIAFAWMQRRRRRAPAQH
jgi:hypothetical protein